MADKWIAAYQARELAIRRRGAVTAEAIRRIENLLIDHARTVLPARAGYRWEKTVAEKEEEEATLRLEERAEPVPDWVWSLNDLDDHPEWDAGIFHFAGLRNGETIYVKLVGVEFCAVEFEKLWPAPTPAGGQEFVEHHMIAARTIAAEEPEQPPKNAKIDYWHLFWLEAMKMLDAGELNRSNHPSQASLRKHLLSRIGERLSEESIKPQVRRIWASFVDGPSG